MTDGARDRQDRFARVLLIAFLLYGSWLLMMVFHEFGHVLHGWVSGAKVIRVVLGPHVVSQTILDPNPHPLFVAWGGAIWGSLLPLGVWAGLAVSRNSRAHLGRFVAGFCLVANGTYIGIGAITSAGDAGDIFLCGCPRWVPGFVGLPLAVVGLYLWHRQGRFFGLGKDALPVRRSDALGTVAVVVVLAALELLLFSGPAR